MTRRFTYQALPMRVRFGAGSLAAPARRGRRPGADPGAGPVLPRAGGRPAAGRRRAGRPRGRRACRGADARAGRGRPPRPRRWPRSWRRRLRRGRRRFGDRAGQGDRAGARPAGDRRPHHLRRLGDDPGLGADRGRAKRTGRDSSGAAGSVLYDPELTLTLPAGAVGRPAASTRSRTPSRASTPPTPRRSSR